MGVDDMDDLPPAYETSESYDGAESDSKGLSKNVQYFSFGDQVITSRSQHVAAVVEKLLPFLRDRAASGLSKSTILLLPSDQGMKCVIRTAHALLTSAVEGPRRGVLTGYEHEDQPIVVQLEGKADTTEFWSQTEALEMLQSQIYAATARSAPLDLPSRSEAALRESSAARKSSWFGKSKRQQVEVPKTKAPAKDAAGVQVILDHVFFRAETEYGLLETIDGRAVLVTVNIE